jgi:anti-sigma regulatory factor (Ser/Thr protein kinase)
MTVDRPSASPAGCQSVPARCTLPAESGSVGRARRAALSFAAGHGLTGARLADVALAVSEAVSNVVVHAYQGRVTPGVLDLTFAAYDDTIQVAIRDFGVGLVARDDSPGLGLGLGVIGRVADRVEIKAPRGGGTELRLVFALERGAA